MEAVKILRLLWRVRLLVAVGFAFALLVGTLTVFEVSLQVPPSFESRQYEVGIASAEVLVDSPNSQVIDLGDRESSADVSSLSARAQLLGDLVATSPLKDRIARRARIAPDLLIAIRPSAVPSVEPTPLETGAATGTSDPSANILSVRVHESLPIIGADAQAPDPATAARISDAAVAELRLYLENAAAADSVPDARKLVVEALGPARSSVVTRGPRRMFAVLGALVIFVIWCAGILVATALARGWRHEASAQVENESNATGPQAPAAVTRAEINSLPDPVGLPQFGRPELPERRVRVATREGDAFSEHPERPEQPRQGAVA